MHDYTNSILEFLLTYLSWAYFLSNCLQCAQFSHCASSFQNNNNNNNTALESSLDFFFFPKYLSWFKKIRWSVPRILMPVQVILRIELLVHHKESSWIGNNTTCSLSCPWLDKEFRAPPKNQAWATWWHYHYYCNHDGEVNAGQVEGDTCHQRWSWKI